MLYKLQPVWAFNISLGPTELGFLDAYWTTHLRLFLPLLSKKKRLSLLSNCIPVRMVIRDTAALVSSHESFFFSFLLFCRLFIPRLFSPLSLHLLESLREEWRDCSLLVPLLLLQKPCTLCMYSTLYGVLSGRRKPAIHCSFRT